MKSSGSPAQHWFNLISRRQKKVCDGKTDEAYWYANGEVYPLHLSEVIFAAGVIAFAIEDENGRADEGAAQREGECEGSQNHHEDGK